MCNNDWGNINGFRGSIRFSNDFADAHTVRPYQVFYRKILATLLPVIYCKNALKTQVN